jgi:hypothetical protein
MESSEKLLGELLERVARNAVQNYIRTNDAVAYMSRELLPLLRAGDEAVEAYAVEVGEGGPGGFIACYRSALAAALGERKETNDGK